MTLWSNTSNLRHFIINTINHSQNFKVLYVHVPYFILVKTVKSLELTSHVSHKAALTRFQQTFHAFSIVPLRPVTPCNWNLQSYMCKKKYNGYHKKANWSALRNNTKIAEDSLFVKLCPAMHRSIAGHNPYNLLIITIVYSKNLPTS